jgi:type I restriction enzyme, S subunit
VKFKGGNLKGEMSAVEGWVTKRFEEIGTIISGSTPSTTVSSFWNGEIVWVTPNDLSKLNTPYLSDSAKRITEKGLDGCSAHLLPAGSVVMSSRAPIGYVALPTVEFCTNQGCKSIALKDDFDPEFTYYNILFNIDKVKNLGEGTTFQEISKTALSKVELDFPMSKPEQSKIAEILSTVDRAIEQTEALIAKQQRIKTGLMQDLLTRGIDEHGNLRSEQTHKFKDSPLGRIPVEWEVRELRTYLSYVSYGFTNPMPEAKDGPYLITAANVSNGEVQYDDCRRTTEDAYEKLLTKKSRPEIGDILITKDGTLGRLAIVERFPICINQSVAVMRTKDEVDNVYLKLLLESPAYQKRIIDDSGGSTIKHIYISKIDKMMIAVPKEKSEQRAVKERLLSQYRQLNQHEGLLKKAKALKAALMQDLLTGKKRVTALLKETGVGI